MNLREANGKSLILKTSEMYLLFNKSNLTFEEFKGLIMGKQGAQKDSDAAQATPSVDGSAQRANIQLQNFILLLGKLLTYEHLFELVRLSAQKFFNTQRRPIEEVFNCLCDDSLDQNEANRFLTPLDFKQILDKADLKLQLINSYEDGINQLELQMFFDWYDSTGDGTVTFQEFCTQMAPRAVEAEAP